MMRAYTSRDVVWLSWHVTAANRRNQPTHVRGEEPPSTWSCLTDLREPTGLPHPSALVPPPCILGARCYPPTALSCRQIHPFLFALRGELGLGLERTTNCLEDITGVEMGVANSSDNDGIGPDWLISHGHCCH